MNVHCAVCMTRGYPRNPFHEHGYICGPVALVEGTSYCKEHLPTLHRTAAAVAEMREAAA